MIEEINNLPSQDSADRERSGDRRLSTCSASSVAMIRRTEYPQNYYGHNEHGPMWTSSLMHAAAVPLNDAQAVLNEIAEKCPNVWAVIYPQNDQGQTTPTAPKP